MHIPKTGGKSFRKILDSQYQSDRVCFMSRIEILERLNDGQVDLSGLGSRKVLHGHFRFNEIAQYVRDNNLKMITWFRNPIDRVISNHRFFIKRLQGDDSTHNEVHRLNIHRKNESLLTYAEMNENRNVICQFLDGTNLKEFFYLGFLEDYSRDILELGSKLGWNVGRIPHEHSNEAFKNSIGQPTAEEIEALRELNRDDIMMYNDALRLKESGFYLKESTSIRSSPKTKIPASILALHIPKTAGQSFRAILRTV